MIPDGPGVMFRSEWHEKWASTPERYKQKPFPRVSRPAVKYLHDEKDILFHGPEPLGTDTNVGLITEDWILNNDYAQAEGGTNLGKVPERGALIAIGFAKPKDGTCGYACYLAICPPDWKHGATIEEAPGVPLPEYDNSLRRDESGVVRPKSPDSADQ